MRALGIDCSLRACAVCLLPAPWFANGVADWSMVETATFGYRLAAAADENERASRLLDVAGKVKLFARRHDADVAVLEQYAFGMRSSIAPALGEVGGCVKVGLLAEGVDLASPVSVAAARKAMLGFVPRNRKGMPRIDPKEPVQQFLRDMGAPFADNPDECDAFCVANWLLAERGFCFVGMRAA